MEAGKELAPIEQTTGLTFWGTFGFIRHEVNLSGH